MPGRKRCNQLDGKTWTRYSISVWSDIRKDSAEIKLNHPAGFPLGLAHRCIEIFTSGPGELVVDPFAGSGTTLMAAANLGRRGVGLELYPGYVKLFRRRVEQEGEEQGIGLRAGEGEVGGQGRNAENPDRRGEKQIAGERGTFRAAGRPEAIGGGIIDRAEGGRRRKGEQERQSEQGALPGRWKPEMIQGDARRLTDHFSPEEVDFVLTSPPYWDIMHSRRSADFKTPRPYGDSDRDLGGLKDYREYLQQLGNIFGQVYRVLKPGGYCVAVVMDLRKKNRFYPLHLDLPLRLEEAGFILEDIIIWDRRHEYNRLRPLGYPAVFRVNKVHEYLLIFKK